MLKLIENVPFDALAWPGNWVWTQDAGCSFEVVQFCSMFTNNEELPKTLHISADNRYKLYIDGEFIGLGPQRGTLERYFFDTYDLSSLKTKSGVHVFSAVVWHDRDTAPSAQISSRPGFLAVAEGKDGKFMGTLDNWKYKRWLGNEIIPALEDTLNAGPGYDMFGFTLNDHCPSKEAFDKDFMPVKALGHAIDHKQGIPQLHLQWNLQPRTIPALKAEKHGLGRCRRLIINDISSQDDALQKSISRLDHSSSGASETITIPAQSRYKILLDKEILVAGYPTIAVSGGCGASIKMTYQEALQSDDDVRSKGNRNEVGQRILVGTTDRFRLQGRDNVILEPLWFRSWRYIEIEIQTSEHPLELKKLTFRSTGYPLKFKATFEADEWFARLIKPALRTFELCSGEIYMDCPYYEQLQYIGDTRIMALLSYVLCDDDRLAREAIDAFDRSRIANGLTQGGYPTRHISELPLFSLIYIAMLNDFLMWRGDVNFIRRYVLGIETILHYFRASTKANGLVGKQTLRSEKACLYAHEWFFVDWTEGAGWKNGAPVAACQGDSFLVSFFYLYALQQAENLYQVLGDETNYKQINQEIKIVRDSLRKEAFDEKRQIFIDDPSGKYLSQHTNILAIITDTYLGLVDGQTLLDNILNDENISKATVYFKFYLFEAMFHIGRADLIWPEFKLWHDMLDNGLTTFAETPEPTRSDCHAWSSHPLYHFIASIIGIRPTAVGCSEISVSPLPKLETTPILSDVLSVKFAILERDCYIRLNATEDGWDIYTELPAEINISESDFVV